MSDREQWESHIDDLVEKHLLFLRGQGPEPDLSGLPPANRAEVMEQLKIVTALADRLPALPPLADDPVAARLGLLGSPVASPRRSEASLIHSGLPSDDPIVVAVREVEFRFGQQVSVEFSPPWPTSLAGMRPIARCTSLGEVVAVCRADVDGWLREPEEVAMLFRQLPELTAVALVSDGADRAVVVSAADTENSVNPLRGWVSPHNPTSPEPLSIALGRHLEQGLPRWDRMVRLDDLLDLGDLQVTASLISTAQIAEAMRAKPRLEYKKDAQRAVSGMDLSTIATLVVEVQTGQIDADGVVERVRSLAGADAT